MKGLLYKKLVMMLKISLPGLSALLLLTIGMEYMSDYIIKTSLNAAESPEVTREVFTSLAAIIGFLFIFLSGSMGAGRIDVASEKKFNKLMCTLPLSGDDIVTSEYICAFVIHVIGFVAAVIYFTVGYFVGLYANPLKDYWQLAIMLFFAAWLSEIIIMPFLLAKVNSIIMFVVQLLIVAMPVATVFFIGLVSIETLLRIAEKINSNITVVLIAVTATSFVLTPFSYLISKHFVKEKPND